MEYPMSTHLSRRDFLKMQALAMGGVALAGSGVYRAVASEICRSEGSCIDPDSSDQKNTLFAELPTCCINEPLGEGEMRITFLGTSCTPMLSQQGVSVYVEVGPTTKIGHLNVPLDYAMFDCGMGVLANYIAAGIPYGRMNKIFIAHLHADHMSELSAIYCFGESADRKFPLYVWGPSKSGRRDPVSHQIYEDGTKATLTHFREVWRWHTEAFSFTSNGYEDYVLPTKESWGTPVELIPVGPKYRENSQGKPMGAKYADPPNDSYALIPIELDWRKVGGVAYDNKSTGLKITHFPVIHCRRGSIGYKLEWTPPNIPGAKTLSMIYSGDTKPNWTMVDQAKGIDVLVHEMVMPPIAWAMKFLHTNNPDEVGEIAFKYLKDVQNSSHTTQGAFGYMLTQIDPAPRLTVATHFQATDDTIASAQTTLDAYGIPRQAYTFASDFMVFNVTDNQIRQRRLDVSAHAFPFADVVYSQNTTRPKYWMLDENGNVVGDPNAQIDNDDWIQPGCDTYDEDGYWPGWYGEDCS
jgi:ribonuclease Z